MAKFLLTFLEFLLGAGITSGCAGFSSDGPGITSGGTGITSGGAGITSNQNAGVSKDES